MPAKRPIKPRQPYLQPSTLALLEHLRDWRQQLRGVVKAHGMWRLLVCFRGWRGAAPSPLHRASLRDSGRLVGAMQLHERTLARRAHDSARRDKAQHFLQLTTAATEAWHSHGRPMEAIVALRWASRRAAEKRAVHAAGGYDIDSQLEEQFRAQEDGRMVSSEQARLAFEGWASREAPACPAAVPSLLDMERACRKQQASKAPGPDGIINEIWKLFPAYAGEWTWLLCAQIALSGHEPAHFKLAVICALYKKGPAALPTNYRSIALMNGLAKIWHGHLRGLLVFGPAGL